MKNDNSTAVMLRFVRELKIPVTPSTIKKEITRHPNANTMLAFSDLLDSWNVNNSAYEVAFDNLINVPLPFIAFTKNDGFAVITQLNSNEVILSNDKQNNKNFSLADFMYMYSGSLLIANKTETSGESDYKQKHLAHVVTMLRLPLILGGIVILIVLLLLLHTTYTQNLNVSIGLLTLFKTLGLATAILLLVQSIDAENPLVQKLCGETDKNCNAILSSKTAKVTSFLSWSEVGFFYFCGTWLALLFNNGNVAIVQMLAVLNILSLPYTFYSIYYQWQVAKQWCIFCCAVQALLWLEFFAFLPNLLNGLQAPALSNFGTMIICLGLPVLFWTFIKPFLTKAQQIEPLQQQLNKFKYNLDLFTRLLKDEIKLVLPADEDTLVIGNRDAENVITIVSNPYCQPCSKAHKALEWLNNKPDVKLQVVFPTADSETDRRAKVASHFLSLQKKGDVIVKNAMHDWYEQKQKDFDKWIENYPVNVDTNNKKRLDKQRDWCRLAEINFTPTIFINGRKIPDFYQPQDLKYFV